MIGLAVGLGISRFAPIWAYYGFVFHLVKCMLQEFRIFACLLHVSCFIGLRGASMQLLWFYKDFNLVVLKKGGNLGHVFVAACDISLTVSLAGGDDAVEDDSGSIAASIGLYFLRPSLSRVKRSVAFIFFLFLLLTVASMRDSFISLIFTLQKLNVSPAINFSFALH